MDLDGVLDLVRLPQQVFAEPDQHRHSLRRIGIFRNLELPPTKAASPFGAAALQGLFELRVGSDPQVDELSTHAQGKSDLLIGALDRGKPLSLDKVQLFLFCASHFKFP